MEQFQAARGSLVQRPVMRQLPGRLLEARGPYAQDQRNAGRPLSKLYLRNCGSWVKRFALAEGSPFIGKRLDEITPLITHDWRRTLAAERGARLVNQIVKATESPFRFAFKMGVIPVSPFAGIGKVAEKTAEREILTWEEIGPPDEAGQLDQRHRLPAHPRQRWSPVARLSELLALTAARRVEASPSQDSTRMGLGLNEFKSTKTKSSPSRDIPVPPEIAAEIKSWPNDAPWVGRETVFLLPSPVNVRIARYDQRPSRAGYRMLWSASGSLVAEQKRRRSGSMGFGTGSFRSFTPER